MSRLIDFAKIEATGNDFIFVDKRKNKIDEISTDKIISMCDRHLGIGADGVVITSETPDQMVKMEYFNADGSRGEMCGNALRATVLFSYMLGNIKLNCPLQLEADDGEHEILMESSENIQVEIKIKNQLENVNLLGVNLENDLSPLGFINTGVPHLVLLSESDLNNINVVKIGRELRFHKMFQPAGTNVNFLKINEINQLQVRTYERGVENETLSCGTGIIASCIAYWNLKGGDVSGISISTLGGDLSVFYSNDKLFLKGPARVAFVGQYSYV